VTKFTFGIDHCNKRTIATGHDKNGMRNFEIRLRNGLFELWTQNTKIKEGWNPVKTSKASIFNHAEFDLYGWAEKQDWADYKPKQESML